MGVGVPSDGEAFIAVNGVSTYQEWEFIYDPRIEQLYAKGAAMGGVSSGSGTSGSGTGNGFGNGLNGNPGTGAPGGNPPGGGVFGGGTPSTPPSTPQ
jgi:hypothetical protein